MRLKFLALSVALALGLTALPAFAQVEKAPPVKDTPTITIVHKKHAVMDPLKSPTEIGVWKPLNTVVLTVVPKGCYDALCSDLRVSHNSRVDAGAAAIAGNIASSQVAIFNYVALSTDTATPVKTDTVCPSEIVGSGLSREVSTFGSYTAPASLNGAASYLMTASWTATAAATVGKICMLNASSAGTLGFETLLGAPVTVANGDTINLTWTFNV